MNLEDLPNDEQAVLYATRYSKNVQTLQQLAETVESSPWQVGATLDRLVEKQILQEVDSFDLAGNDAICYGYHPYSEVSDIIYDQVHPERKD